MVLPTAWINDGIGFNNSIKREFDSSSVDNSYNIAGSRCFDNGKEWSFEPIFGIQFHYLPARNEIVSKQTMKQYAISSSLIVSYLLVIVGTLQEFYSCIQWPPICPHENHDTFHHGIKGRRVDGTTLNGASHFRIAL